MMVKIIDKVLTKIITKRILSLYKKKDYTGLKNDISIGLPSSVTSHLFENVFPEDKDMQEYLLPLLIPHCKLTVKQQEEIFFNFPEHHFILAKTPNLCPEIQFLLAEKAFKDSLTTTVNANFMLVYNNLIIRNDVSEETFKFITEKFSKEAFYYKVELTKIQFTWLIELLDESPHLGRFPARVVPPENYVFSHESKWFTLKNWFEGLRFFNGEASLNELGKKCIHSCLKNCFNENVFDEETFKVLEGSWQGTLHDLLEATIIFGKEKFIEGSENV